MNSKRLLRVFHRYFGLIVAIFLLMLAVTGILLNHTEELHLDDRHVSQSWILKLYGVPQPELKVAYREGNFLVSQWDNLLFLQFIPVSDLHGDLKGLIQQDDFLIVALQDRIALITQEGELIDALVLDLAANDVVNRIGVTQQGDLVVDGRDGMMIADAEITSLSPWSNDAESVTWSQSSKLSKQELKKFHKQYRGDGLPLERVLLDLHSGRILGMVGVLFMDSMAVLIVVLVITGGFIWWNTTSLRRRKKR